MTLPMLSPHEARVAALVAEGWRNHVIAERLGYSVQTVESVVARIYARTGINADPDLDKRAALVRLLLIEQLSVTIVT